MTNATSPFPRVLFVTPAAFNRITGGGITFSALFRGWPPDRIATAHSDAVPTTDDVCSRYYHLGPGEIARWPRLAANARNATAETQPVAMDNGTSHSAPLRLAKQWLAGNAWPDTGRLTPALASWITAFRPDLLYTILGTIGMMEIVDAIRRRFRLPLVVHFMDDWPAHLYRGGALSFAAHARMQALIRRLVGTAATRMAIGDAMAEAYAQRYGVPFVPFQNAIDLNTADQWMRAGVPHDRGDGTVRVLYVGSIFDNAQAQSLIDVAQAVYGLAGRGRAIRFDLYSPLHLAERFRRRLEISAAVRLHDTIVDDARFFRTIAEADILVMPVNFDRDSVRLIHYSMPTKLPAYLVSGTPILAYGPPGVAQIEDARRQGWGLVLDRRGADGVAEAIGRLADDVTLRQQLVERARTIAERRHDASAVRRAFQQHLTAAAGATRCERPTPAPLGAQSGQ